MTARAVAATRTQAADATASPLPKPAGSPAARVSVRGFAVRLPDPRRRGHWLPVLGPLNLDLAPGATVVSGPSGAGKTMLVRALAGLLPAGAQNTGTLRAEFAGEAYDLTRIGARTWRRLRGRQIGTLTAEATFTPTRTIAAQLREVAPGLDPAALAARVSLPADRFDRRPDQLSGGELRRATLAVALAGDPAVLLCDEPTAGLDPATASAIAELIARRAATGRVVLVVTHDPAVAEVVGGRQVELVDGVVRTP